MAQRMFAEAYREEARKLAALPDGGAGAAAALDASTSTTGSSSSTEYVEARPPRRPWQHAELQLCLDTLTAAVAGPHAAARRSSSCHPPSEEFAGVAGVLGPPAHRPARSCRTSTRPPRWPRSFVEVTTGETLVHTDVRDDNLLLTDRRPGAAVRLELADGRRRLAGLAVPADRPARRRARRRQAVIAGHPLLSAVPRGATSTSSWPWSTGYFLKSADDPVPPTSPFLRDAQRWQGEVCWDWLCERRGWA